MTTIITNSDDKNLKAKLILLASKADRIDIAVAFFSDHQLLKRWEQEKKEINVIISLRPPTNYYSLKAIQSLINIKVNFLGDNFHSKFIIFYKEGVAISAVLGSSNFTSGGLINNIETNIYIEEKQVLSKLQQHFDDLLQDSHLLQPTDLERYETVYMNFLTSQKKTEDELRKFKNEITMNRTKQGQKVKITKEASLYLKYWKIVDEIRDLIKNICDREYPGIPYYFVLDFFWDFIKVIWHKETERTLSRTNQKIEIPKIFNKYIEWNRSIQEGNYLKCMTKRSIRVFQAYLSEKNINSLTKTKAKEIFQSLHSSRMPIQRFRADDLFIDKNDIKKIRTSFKYLLYSNDEMDLRIHNLIKNPQYKLQMLGSSGVQEINGWTRPTIYPIRNDKADAAIEILGYKLN
ncbi:MAG: phospholipase D-like domain-containing protein [Ignavibacteriaceae bacterium]|jgi:HKD family nuclease